jgi:cell fate (sporulation/competence/biofilm development) regulator YlbF (YheA/YmcA/DUF963 family)
VRDNNQEPNNNHTTPLPIIKTNNKKNNTTKRQTATFQQFKPSTQTLQKSGTTREEYKTETCQTHKTHSHMDNHDKLTDDKHTINAAREIIDNTDPVHKHIWTASREDREETGAHIYSVKFAIVREVW